MRISIGGDHRGFLLKGTLAEWLRQSRHEVTDVGANCAESSDYPDFAAAVAEQVSRGEADRGILICGSALGMAIVANKFIHVRAGPVHDEESARLSRAHNDLNVLCLSSDQWESRDVTGLVKLWLETPFDGGRHARRVDKIREIEQRNFVDGAAPGG